MSVVSRWGATAKVRCRPRCRISSPPLAAMPAQRRSNGESRGRGTAANDSGRGNHVFSSSSQHPNDALLWCVDRGGLQEARLDAHNQRIRQLLLNRRKPMPGVITGLTALVLHCWWNVRTTNSPALKRSWPYPRSFKVNADLYRRARSSAGRCHARSQARDHTRRLVAQSARLS